MIEMDLKGTAYEIGCQHGRQAPELIRRFPFGEIRAPITDEIDNLQAAR